MGRWARARGGLTDEGSMNGADGDMPTPRQKQRFYGGGVERGVGVGLGMSGFEVSGKRSANGGLRDVNEEGRDSPVKHLNDYSELLSRSVLSLLFTFLSAVLIVSSYCRLTGTASTPAPTLPFPYRIQFNVHTLPQASKNFSLPHLQGLPVISPVDSALIRDGSLLLQ